MKNIKFFGIIIALAICLSACANEDKSSNMPIKDETQSAKTAEATKSTDVVDKVSDALKTAELAQAEEGSKGRASNTWPAEWPDDVPKIEGAVKKTGVEAVEEFDATSVMVELDSPGEDAIKAYISKIEALGFENMIPEVIASSTEFSYSSDKYILSLAVTDEGKTLTLVVTFDAIK